METAPVSPCTIGPVRLFLLPSYSATGSIYAFSPRPDCMWSFIKVAELIHRICMYVTSDVSLAYEILHCCKYGYLPFFSLPYAAYELLQENL